MATDETHPRLKRFLAQQPKPTALPALDDSAQAELIGLGRALVRIREERTRLLDPDNLYGSVKSLLDGLQQAGLITGDSSAEIDLEVTQVKVPHRSDQKTVIEIFYAETPR